MSTNGNSTIGGPGTSPEDIAAAAGLPHQAAPHTLHTDADKAAASLRDGVADALHAPGEAETHVERVKDASSRLAGQASDTFDGIKEKVTAVASDTRARVGDAAQNARATVTDAYGDSRRWAAEQSDVQRRRLNDISQRGTERFHQGKSGVETFVSQNPLLVGVVGVAAGLLLGALLPRTRGEDRAVGPWADEVRDQGMRYARDITSKGREFVETALDPEAVNGAVQRAAAAAEPASAEERLRPH